MEVVRTLEYISVGYSEYHSFEECVFDWMLCDGDTKVIYIPAHLEPIISYI